MNVVFESQSSGCKTVYPDARLFIREKNAMYERGSDSCIWYLEGRNRILAICFLTIGTGKLSGNLNDILTLRFIQMRHYINMGDSMLPKSSWELVEQYFGS
ncbi:hypothetical protein MAR_035519 [Mya arenaria]|uniref:Uncharacterized protein n=1 Tax=Mya arenaria TaxID=6604 RepID=A0ABY7EKC5_MYAAR|nr:hypothetical protein MAR_035519 [Mya arenaria]